MKTVRSFVFTTSSGWPVRAVGTLIGIVCTWQNTTVAGPFDLSMSAVDESAITTPSDNVIARFQKGVVGALNDSLPPSSASIYGIRVPLNKNVVLNVTGNATGKESFTVIIEID